MWIPKWVMIMFLILYISGCDYFSPSQPQQKYVIEKEHNKFEIITIKYETEYILYKLNKETGETWMFIPGSKSGGWAKVSETDFITIPPEEKK